MRLTHWIVASGLIGLSTACDPATSPDPTPDALMPVGFWELQSLDSGTTPVPDPPEYTLELRDDGQAHVGVACNVCGGSYEVTGPSLSFGLMACTLAACPESLHDQYLDALGSVASWERSGSELRLGYDGGTLRFTAR